LSIMIPDRIPRQTTTRDGERWKGLTIGEWLTIALGVIPVVFALIASLAPPVAKDSLLYHFALPKAFVSQHANIFVDGNIASYLALGTEMNSVWAMLIGSIVSPRSGEAGAGATTFLFYPLLLMAVYGWARETGVSRASAL